MAKRNLADKMENLGSNLPAVQEDAALPAYLDGYKGDTGLEAFSGQDFKMPRLKLLQALSPEVRDNAGEAIAGEFWVTTAKESLGNEFTFISAIATRRVTLWAPRASGGGILAVASNGVHWDKPNHEFEVEIKKNTRVTWNTRNTVQESRLLDWGTSNPNDKDSQPAATLSYDFMAYICPHGEFSPIVFSLYRTGINVGRDLLSQLKAASKGRLPIQFVRIKAMSKEVSGPEGDYYTWQFKLAGRASEEEFNNARSIAEQFRSYDIAGTEIELDASDYAS